MPWQAYIHDVANEVDPVTGWWAYDEIVITVPRQAGKTTLKIPLYAHRMQITPRGELWMTAQNGKKAVKRWEVASQFMIDTPELQTCPGYPGEPLKRWVTVAKERLQWRPTGALLVPFAPDDENMHGESPDLVDVDEWWAFDKLAADGLQSSYQPGFLTKNGQAWKTSTMGTELSHGLNADVKKGRAAVEMDRRSGTAYFEWSLEDEPYGIPIKDLSDEDLIRACIEIHPAIGFHPKAPAEKMRHTISTQLGEGEGKLTRPDFLRAWGNRLQASSGGWQVISQPSWVKAMARKAIPPEAAVGFGFELDPDGREGAIAVAWRNGDGVATVEVIKVADGVGWVGPDLRELLKRWKHVQIANQNSGPARHVADGLISDDIEVLRLSQTDYSAACALFHAGVTDKRGASVLHVGQAPLNSAVEHAEKRRTSPTGSWAWRVDPDVPGTTLVACTAALWAVDHPRETGPAGRFRMH